MLRGVPGLIYFAVPNGMVSDPITVRNMKAQGLMPGAPDLVIFIPEEGDYAPETLCLEVKSKKGRLSDAQLAFEANCARIGISYIAIYDIKEALEILELYGAIKPDRSVIPAKAAA